MADIVLPTEIWKQERSNCSSPFGPSVSQGKGSYVPVSTATSKRIVKTPGFNKLRASGAILPVNPYEVSRVTTSRVPGSTDVYDNWNGTCFLRRNFGTEYWPQIENFTMRPPEPSEGQINDVINNAVRQSTSATFDLATFAGESRQTFAMLKHSMNSLCRVMDEAYVLSRAKRISLDDAWLQLRFGWMPLIYDVRSAIEAVNRSVEPGSLQHGGSRRVLNYGDTRTTVTTPAGGVRRTITETIRSTTSVRGFAIARVESPTFARYGLNPLTTGWELTRFSFIVDWFFDVGSWLAANSTAFTGSSVQSSGYSLRTDTTQVITMLQTWGHDSSNTAGQLAGMSVTRTTRSYERFPRTGGGLPAWKPSISTLHVADLTTILSQWRRKWNK